MIARSAIVGLSWGILEGCESTRQPANAIHGRAEGLVDAIGFICDKP